MISINVPRNVPTAAEVKELLKDPTFTKGLGLDGYMHEGLTFGDIFGAPGDSAHMAQGYQAIAQIRGWNHTSILAKSLQFALASMTVFCSPEIANLISTAGHEKYKAANRVSGIEHYNVPQDWVQAPREFRVSELMRAPNPWEDEALWRFKLCQQIEAHGVAYILIMPNEDGVPSQMHIIPKTSLSPIPPSAKHPEGAWRIAQLSIHMRSFDENQQPQSYQEMLAWLSNKDYAAKYIIPIGVPSYVWPADFQNLSSAIADVIDTDRAIHESRRNTLNNQTSDGPMLSEEEGFTVDPDTKLSLLEQHNSNAAGTRNSGKAWWKPKGVAVDNEKHSAREMEYTDSANQSRDAVMGQRMTPPAMVGLGDLTSYASVVAVMNGWARMTAQPMMRIVAGQLTVGLQRFFQYRQDREFICVMQAGSIEDPELKLREIESEISAQAMTVGEYRESKNRDPFGDERDDAIVGTLATQQQADAAAKQQAAAGGIPGKTPGQGGPPAAGPAEDDRAPVRGTGAGQDPEEKPAAGLGGLSRQQLKRNRTAIFETLTAVETGQMRPKTAIALLRTLGLSPAEAQEMLDSLRDDEVPNPAERPGATPEVPAEEEKAVEQNRFFTKLFAKAKDTGIDRDGDGTTGDGTERERPADYVPKKRTGKPSPRKGKSNTEGLSPDEVLARKERQRAAGRRAAINKKLMRRSDSATSDGTYTLEEAQEIFRDAQLLHAKRRVIDGELSLREYETIHEHFAPEIPLDREDMKTWREKTPADLLDEEIDKIVAEHPEVDWMQFKKTVQGVWEHHEGFRAQREEWKKDLHKLTGMTQKKAAKHNQESDHDSIDGFDTAARSLIIQNPEIGIDEDQAADYAWQLLIAPHSKPIQKYDPIVISQALDIHLRGQSGDAGEDGEVQPFIVPPAHDAPSDWEDDFIPEEERTYTRDENGRIVQKAFLSLDAIDEIRSAWFGKAIEPKDGDGDGYTRDGQPDEAPVSPKQEKPKKKESAGQGQSSTKRDVSSLRRRMNSLADPEPDEQEILSNAGGLADKVRTDGGYTFHEATSSFPTEGFSVSIYPERELILESIDKVNQGVIADYIVDNLDLADADGRVYYGAWHNKYDPKTGKGDDKVYLDMVKVVESQEEATALAKEHGQLKIFDLSSFEEIETMTAEERKEWERKNGRGKGFEKSYGGGRSHSGEHRTIGGGSYGKADRYKNYSGGNGRAGGSSQEEAGSEAEIAATVTKWLRQERSGRLAAPFQ